jgi:hypothetical protein
VVVSYFQKTSTPQTFSHSPMYAAQRRLFERSTPKEYTRLFHHYFYQVTLWRAGQQQQRERQRSQSQGANAPSEEEKGINWMRLGLLQSNTHARYFGGSLDLMALDEWGESHAYHAFHGRN